jgi:hypothetical protein
MFKFNSGSIESSIADGQVVVGLLSPMGATPQYYQASLSLHEDEAVELATLLLAQAQKLRAERLEAHGLAYPYAE